MSSRILVLLTVLSCSGCAATLTNPIKVRTPQAYLMEKKTVSEKEEAGKKLCVETLTAEVVYLPGGEEQEVDFERGVFASNQFTVQLSDAGTLKQVSLNSDPQVDETIAAVATLIEKAAGAAAAAAPAAARAPDGSTTCVPKISVKLTPLGCFIDPTKLPAGTCS